MSRTNLFLKVEIEHEPEDEPQKLADEICRSLKRLYGVRDAQLSNFSVIEE